MTAECWRWRPRWNLLASSTSCFGSSACLQSSSSVLCKTAYGLESPQDRLGGTHAESAGLSTVNEEQRQWTVAQPLTILASIRFKICWALLVSTYVRRDCIQRFSSQMHKFWMLMLYNSTFFLWPIWLFIVSDRVFPCGRCGCGQYGCGRYGTDPSAVYSQLKRVTDRRTDRQTEMRSQAERPLRNAC